jgi:hypothetical protein
MTEYGQYGHDDAHGGRDHDDHDRVNDHVHNRRDSLALKNEGQYLT